MEESKSVPGARKVRKPSSGGRSSRKSSHSSVASLTDSEFPETSESTGSDNLGLPKNNLPNGTHLDGDRVSEQSGAKEKNNKESTVATSKDNEETAEQNGTSKKEGNSKSYETISDISEDIKIIQSSSRELSAKSGGNDTEKGDKDLVNTTNKSESETKKKKHKIPKKEEKGDENKVIKKKIIKKKVVKENEKNIGGNVNVNIVDKETKKTESGKDVKESEKENSLELNIGYKSEKSGGEQKVKERPRKQSTETKPKVKEGGSKKSEEHKKKIVKEDNSSSGEEQSKSFKKNESDSSSDDGSTSKLDFAGFDNPNNEKSTMFFRILDDIRIDDSVMEDITEGETENETEKKEDDLNTSDVYMEDDRTDQEDDYDYDGSDDIFAPEVVCVPMSGDVPYQFGKDDLSTTSSTPSLSSIFGGGSSRKRTRDRGGIKKPPVDLSSPQFLKPFEYGWKRELVFRSVSDIGTSKRNADIYYYTPKGKKVRSTREVIENLTDVELTIDNFTFFKEPIGINDPEKEIIREAKVRAERDHSSTPPPAKKPSLPKTPKGEKAAKVMSPSHSDLSPEHTSPPKVGIANFSATPKIVLKAVKVPSAKNKSSSKSVFTPPSKSSSSKDKRGHRDSEDELEMGMLPPLWPTPPEKGTAREIAPSTKVPGTSKTIEVCSIRCPLAMGLIPTLQCHLCLCLYHPECVGIEEAINRTIHSYVCKNCQEAKKGGGISGPVLNKVTPPVLTTPPPLTPISNLGINSNTSQSSPASSPPKLQRLLTDKLPTTSKSQKIVGGVTTWLPPSSMIQLTSKNTSSKASVPAVPTVESASALGSMPTQTLMSMNGKRYVVVPKHNVLSVSPAITTSGVSVSDPHSPGSTFVSCNSTTNDTTVSSSSVSNTLIATTNPVLPSVSIIPNTLTTNSNTSISLLPPIVNPGDPSSRAFIMNNPTTPTNPAGVLLVPCVTTASNSKDGSKFVIVNGPSGIPTGNFIIGNIPPQQQLQLPAVPTTQPAIPSNEPASGIKRANDDNDKTPSAKRSKKESTSGSSFSSSTSTPIAANTALPDDAATPLSDLSPNASFDKDYFMTNVTAIYHALIHSFQYLKVQELLGASRVCRLWRDIAHHKSLWQTVRMKNSRVRDWEGFASMLRYSGTKHLDLRKMLVPDKPESLCEMWSDYARAIERVNHLLRIDMCRCPASAIEITVRKNPGLQVFSALSIKCSVLDLKPFENCKNLTELRLKTTDKTGMNVENISVLSSLTRLKHLSLPSIKTIPLELTEVLQNLVNLESLELGDCATLDEKVAVEGFPKLKKLQRLRLEKGGSSTPTIPLLYSISDLPSLTQLELINFDIKPGFDSALSLCSNLRTLLIIPTYVTQSATTNHVVMEGVSKLSKTLMHFVWGITLELLKVTDLFIDQWEGQKGPMKSPPSSSSSTSGTPKKGTGDSIPILKPLNDENSKEGGNTPSQVDILQLPKLHRVLTTLLPTTKIKILKVPFAATWRQTVTGPSNPQ